MCFQHQAGQEPKKTVKWAQQKVRSAMNIESQS